jgi:hypothetical protein
MKEVITSKKKISESFSSFDRIIFIVSKYDFVFSVSFVEILN